MKKLFLMFVLLLASAATPSSIKNDVGEKNKGGNLKARHVLNNGYVDPDVCTTEGAYDFTYYNNYLSYVPDNSYIMTDKKYEYRRQISLAGAGPYSWFGGVVMNNNISPMTLGNIHFQLEVVDYVTKEIIAAVDETINPLVSKKVGNITIKSYDDIIGFDIASAQDFTITKLSIEIINDSDENIIIDKGMILLDVHAYEGEPMEFFTVPMNFSCWMDPVFGYDEVEEGEGGISTLYVKHEYGTKFVYPDAYLLAYDREEEMFFTPTRERDEYINKENTLNTYYLISYFSEDASKNRSYLHFYVKNVDTVKPSLGGPSIIRASYASPLPVEEIIKQFTTTDNYPVIAPVLSIEDTEEMNNLKLIGEHSLNVISTDYSGNKTSFTFRYVTIDDVAPVISGPQRISTSVDKKLREEDILKMFNCDDEIDGVCTLSSVKSNYFTRNETIGTYPLEITGRDKSGNEKTYSSSISIIDERGPVFYIDADKIKTYVGEINSASDLTKTLMLSNLIPNSNYISSRIIEGELKNEVGEYKIKLELTAEGDVTTIVEISVLVGEKLEFEKALSFWEKIGKWFTSLWSSMTSFFANIF